MRWTTKHILRGQLIGGRCGEKSTTREGTTNKTNIDWPGLTHTWNPVTGCKRGCEYCYAKKNWNRLHRKRYGCEFSEIVLHEDRISEPSKVKKSSVIFVGSMTDIWYWSIPTVEMVIEQCEAAYWHTFMFLSKDYRAYHGHRWPKNTRCGVTLETFRAEPPQRQVIEQHLNHKKIIPFFSIEPLSGTLKVDIKTAHTVIVGAETGNRKGRYIPQKDWIQSIRDHVPASSIWWKKNMVPYL